jgi:hypothetical protein
MPFAITREDLQEQQMSQKTASPKTVRVEVTFRSPSRAGSVLAELSRVPGVLLNILRGRVTSGEAVYEVELSGRGAGVKQVIWSLRAGASCP